jgi:coproporphyrinogen III oxidase-like Fe-S oxidoreductase
VFRPVVRELCEFGLLTQEEDVVRLTRRGVLFSNDVFACFLAGGEPAGVPRQELLIQIQ